MIVEAGPPPFWFCAPDSAERGSEYHPRYATAQPFPHIVLDEFLPEELAELCVANFPERQVSPTYYARSQENLKFEFKPESLSPALRSLFYSFNSAPFIGFLENLTGIRGLIPDPYFSGGGLHEVAHGGHLSIHADFNHHAILNLERRINVLIYLNRDWKEEYGGCFEIWNREMTKRCLRVLPLFNRCVVFNTSSASFHGNPDPVNHPLGSSRRSIALYYYTATWDGLRRSHSTHFKVRPNSTDQFDFSIWMNELLTDVTPPILMRTAARLSNRLRRMIASHRNSSAENASTVPH
jgi:Rps23 Pro-64 3,4-dihydroxylase Tpa1-like proline 4-hydroxylase